MIMMILGMLLLVDGPIPEMRVKLLTALSVAIPLGVITVFLLTLAVRARRNKVVTGKESLIGEIGVARSPLLPTGKVFVRGSIWNAIASVNIDVGQSAIVRNVQGLTLQEWMPPRNLLRWMRLNPQLKRVNLKRGRQPGLINFCRLNATIPLEAVWNSLHRQLLSSVVIYFISLKILRDAV